MAEPQVLNLTQENVEALRYQGEDGPPQFVWDAEATGFGVRLTASGTRSFVLRYRVLGRQRLKTLGDTANHKLKNARIWARAGLAAADKNEDFQAAEEQQRALGTIAALWRRYIDERIKVRGSAQTLTNLESLWTTHLEKPFGSKRLTEIATADVRAWHRRTSERRTVTVKVAGGEERPKAIGGPYTANRALQALRAAINWQLDEGTLPDGFRNPCVGAHLNHEKARAVILRPDELPKLAGAINAHPDIYAGAFVWLAIFTGARRSELLGLTWDHIDLKRGQVTFTDTKNKTDRTVPLAAAAVKRLKELPRVEDSPYVFPGRWGRGHRINVKDAWSEMRTAAGLPHLHLHDVRRSVGSWLGAAGHTAPQVGELLGHKSDITSRVYIQLAQLDVKRELVNVHAGLIDAALNGKKKKAARK